MRQRALAEQQLRELGESVGVTDPDVIHELAELGFTPETVKLLPLIPVLETAWAGGGVTPKERQMVVDFARARGSRKRARPTISSSSGSSGDPRKACSGAQDV